MPTILSLGAEAQDQFKASQGKFPGAVAYRMRACLKTEEQNKT